MGKGFLLLVASINLWLYSIWLNKTITDYQQWKAFFPRSVMHAHKQTWGIGTVSNNIMGNKEYIHHDFEVWTSYEAWQGAAAVVHLAFCEDYSSLGIRTLCWLVQLKACHFASSTGCLLGITPVQWWVQVPEFPASCGHDCATEYRASVPWFRM